MNLSRKKLNNYYKQAMTIAELSPDEQTKVGALLINYENRSVINNAYNGFIRKGPDKDLPKTRPEKYEFIIHAEINLLCNCLLNHVSPKNCFVFCTLSPCANCCRLLYQSGIREVYFKDTYRDFENTMQMKDIYIAVTEVQSYNRLIMKPRDTV